MTVFRYSSPHFSFDSFKINVIVSFSSTWSCFVRAEEQDTHGFSQSHPCIASKSAISLGLLSLRVSRVRHEQEANTHALSHAPSSPHECDVSAAGTDCGANDDDDDDEDEEDGTDVAPWLLASVALSLGGLPYFLRSSSVISCMAPRAVA